LTRNERKAVLAAHAAKPKHDADLSHQHPTAALAENPRQQRQRQSIHNGSPHDFN
jgi:hypothetical protein